MNDQQWTRRYAGRLGKLDPRAPRYQRLEQALKKLIAGAGAKPAVLPGERSLARMTGFSRVTVRRALSDLGSLGSCIPRLAPVPMSASASSDPLVAPDGIYRGPPARGLNPRVLFLERSGGEANAEEAMALSIAPATPVIRLRRLRFGDDRILALERTVVPQEFIPDATLVEESLYEALEARGHRPARAMQRLRAVSIDGEAASLMDVPEGTAGLAIERRAFVGDGRAVEFTRSIYRGDAYDFVAELEARNS